MHTTFAIINFKRQITLFGQPIWRNLNFRGWGVYAWGCDCKLFIVIFAHNQIWIDWVSESNYIAGSYHGTFESAFEEVFDVPFDWVINLNCFWAHCARERLNSANHGSFNFPTDWTFFLEPISSFNYDCVSLWKRLCITICRNLKGVWWFRLGP